MFRRNQNRLRLPLAGPRTGGAARPSNSGPTFIQPTPGTYQRNSDSDRQKRESCRGEAAAIGCTTLTKPGTSPTIKRMRKMSKYIVQLVLTSRVCIDNKCLFLSKTLAELIHATPPCGRPRGSCSNILAANCGIVISAPHSYSMVNRVQVDCN